VVFNENCQNDVVYWSMRDVAQPIAFRCRVLLLVLQLYKSLLASGRQIRSLSIQCLQNINDPDIVNSEDFKLLVSGLTSLRLWVVSECNDRDPELNILYKELHQFALELPAVYLQPSAATLTSLVLYFSEKIGYFPQLRLRALHFPRLRHLVLGNHAFSHDWQFDWIIEHASTLEELFLDDCGIIYARNTSDQVDDEGYLDANDFIKEWPEGMAHDEYPQRSRYFTYERRWHHIFDRFSRELPNLRDFRFGDDNWDNLTMFTDCDLLSRELHNRMYLVFDMVDGWPFQHNPDRDSTENWQQNGDDGVSDFAYPNCREEDSASFDRLLARFGLHRYWQHAIRQEQR